MISLRSALSVVLFASLAAARGTTERYNANAYVTALKNTTKTTVVAVKPPPAVGDVGEF